ncbi:extracellular solute-binding protein [Floridanema evergladense]|uniref:Extracellular solute-binding protein n=1 Tax=Floridaenema evergladense BLCC-F167 TaxID=3153639 RepID=A0ABV4WQH9_9CYAN
MVITWGITSCSREQQKQNQVSIDGGAVGYAIHQAIAACSGSNANTAPKPDVNLNLVSYSVTQAAYEQIVPKFVEKWKKEQNQNVTINQSFGGSGSQARAVIDAKAQKFTTKVYKNVPLLASNAREASELFFNQGKGDVLLNYEDEVILAQQNGNKLPYIVPDVNISIDNPIAVVDKNVDRHGTRKVAEAFVDFLYSTEAQQEFAKLGYRPVNPSVVAEVSQNYPQIKTLFTVQDLGGWDIVQNRFFAEGAIFDKIQVASKF